MHKVLLLCAFFMLANTLVNANTYILKNDGIISEKVSDKINSMGSELFLKTSVSVYLAVPKSLKNELITNYEKNLLENLKAPYVLLTLAKNEKQVDIMYSKDLEGKIDKEAILSPFPWSGTIIPLLAGKKENDKYNAAMLNGYADIVETIADSYDVELESAIGNINKDILHYVKILLLLFLVIVIGRYVLKKVRRND